MKLVRDKIPEILEAKGLKVKTIKIEDQSNYMISLKSKLIHLKIIIV